MATTKQGYLMWPGAPAKGSSTPTLEYVGVAPSTTTPYFAAPGTRPGCPGGWELIVLTLQPNGSWQGIWQAAQLVVSIQNDGTIQTRPLTSFGNFEQLQARSESDTARDVIYRTDLGGSICKFQEA